MIFEPMDFLSQSLQGDCWAWIEPIPDHSNLKACCIATDLNVGLIDQIITNNDNSTQVVEFSISFILKNGTTNDAQIPLNKN